MSSSARNLFFTLATGTKIRLRRTYKLPPVFLHQTLPCHFIRERGHLTPSSSAAFSSIGEWKNETSLFQRTSQ